MSAKPAIRGIVETCINVADMSRARAFYESVLGFEAMVHDERFCAFRVGVDVLLLFTQGASDRPVAITGESFRRMTRWVLGILPSRYQRMN